MDAAAIDRRKVRRDKLLREIPLYIMLIPAVIVTLIWSYGPMFGLRMAFTRFSLARGIFGSEWTGLDNVRTLISMPNFWPVVRNTVGISLANMILMIIVPVTFSLLLNEVKNMGLKRGLQTMVFLPNFISWIILSSLFIDILSPSTGVVNQMFGWVGISPIFFLGEQFWFPITMVATNVWRSFGFGSVIYLAALSSIDPNLYEAAEIDGANRWKQTINVTLPGMKPTIVLLSVLAMGGILNAGFDQIVNMYNPAVFATGDVLDTWIFRMGIQGAQWSLSAAMGFFRSVVSLIFVVMSYYLADKLAGYKIF